MALNYFYFGFVILTGIFFTYAYWKFQKPLAGIIAGSLFLLFGLTLLFNGFVYPTGWTEGNDTITYGYQNFTARTDTYTCPETYELNETNPDECIKRSGTGVVNSTEVVALTYYEPHVVNETSSYGASTINEATTTGEVYTNSIGLIFVLLGLFLTAISTMELVYKPVSKVA